MMAFVTLPSTLQSSRRFQLHQYEQNVKYLLNAHVVNLRSARPITASGVSKTFGRRNIYLSLAMSENAYNDDLHATRGRGIPNGQAAFVLSAKGVMKRSRTFVEKIKAMRSNEWEQVLRALQKAEGELVNERDVNMSGGLYRPGVNVHMYTACISQLTKAGRYREALDIFIHRMPATQVR